MLPVEPGRKQGGKWFPDIRKATPEQTRTYREAVHDLHTDSLYQQAAGIREENPRYMDLNDRVVEAERPLSRTQARWNFQRVDAESDLRKLQRESDRQDRARGHKPGRERAALDRAENGPLPARIRTATARARQEFRAARGER
jgi:hypothetical protein